MSTDSTAASTTAGSSATAKPAPRTTATKPAAKGLLSGKNLIVGGLIAVGAWTLLSGPGVSAIHGIEAAYQPKVTMKDITVTTPGAVKK